MQLKKILPLRHQLIKVLLKRNNKQINEPESNVQIFNCRNWTLSDLTVT